MYEFPKNIQTVARLLLILQTTERSLGFQRVLRGPSLLIATRHCFRTSSLDGNLKPPTMVHPGTAQYCGILKIASCPIDKMGNHLTQSCFLCSFAPLVYLFCYSSSDRGTFRLQRRLAGKHSQAI
jgi:hypothetical protein